MKSPSKWLTLNNSVIRQRGDQFFVLKIISEKPFFDNYFVKALSV